MVVGKRVIHSLLLCCVTAGPVGLLLAAISGGHHVPDSQGTGSAMGWDCGWRAVCPLGQLLLPAKKKREC